jgi:hypothetical protein
MSRPDDVEQNSSRCLCPGCPTYNQCMRDAGQRMFCARGMTECTPSAHGCICGDCPVWADYGLGQYYFCLEGPAD